MNLLSGIDPPYVAVIFSSRRPPASETSIADDGYDAMATEMEHLGAQQPGFLGIESARNADGSGITVSYWRNEADAIAWKAVAAHLRAQTLGRDRWYLDYTTRVATVTRHYDASSGIST